MFSVKKKEPVTPEVIQRLVAHYGAASASLADLCLLLLCLLGYAGFFGFNEFLQLHRYDFRFEDSFMRIFFQHSKPDIFRDGGWVIISKSSKPTCPVLLTLRYFAVTSFFEKIVNFSFFVYLLSIVVMDPYRSRCSVLLSYCRACEIVLCALRPLAFPEEITVFIA